VADAQRLFLQVVIKDYILEEVRCVDLRVFIKGITKRKELPWAAVADAAISWSR
jgi:hypothetical protein